MERDRHTQGSDGEIQTYLIEIERRMTEKKKRERKKRRKLTRQTEKDMRSQALSSTTQFLSNF